MCVRIVARLCPLSADVIHDLVFPFPGNVGVRQDHFDVLPARVAVQSDMDVVAQTVSQAKHERRTLKDRRRGVRKVISNHGMKQQSFRLKSQPIFRSWCFGFS